MTISWVEYSICFVYEITPSIKYLMSFEEIVERMENQLRQII